MCVAFPYFLLINYFRIVGCRQFDLPILCCFSSGRCLWWRCYIFDGRMFFIDIGDIRFGTAFFFDFAALFEVSSLMFQLSN